MARGRAWGNALGGWRLQGRGPRGRWLPKGAGSRKSNYRPSRNQIAEQQRQAAIRKTQRRAKAKKVAKGVAIVGGTALAAGGAYYGLRAVSAAPAGAFTAHMDKKFVRNAAKYSQKAPTTNVAKATKIQAGNFPQIYMSPRAPIGLKGFSTAAAASHSVNKLLPPISYRNNTRRPARFRYTGEELRNVQPANPEGKELIPKRDMTREIRSMSMKKTNWRKRADKALTSKRAAAAARAAEVQNPKPAQTSAAKNRPVTSKASPATSKPKNAKKETAPKSKAVQSPKGAVTTDDIAPLKPATGKGSAKTKSSPAKQAATGGAKTKTGVNASPLPQDHYTSNYAPMEDSDEVRIVGGQVLEGVDPYGEKVSIPIAGRSPSRSHKPVGGRPGAAPARPRANNQPKPQETVQRQATKAAGNELNVPASVRVDVDPSKLTATNLNSPDHGSAWYAKVFNVSQIEKASASGLNKVEIKNQMIAQGIQKATAQKFADAVADYRKANKRSKTMRNALTGQKMGKDEKRAAAMAGDVTTRTKSDSERIASLNDKMASGKMPFTMGDVKSAEELLKGLGGMHKYTASLLWEEATGRNKTLYSVEERKAMRLYSNWLNLKKTMK